MKITEDMDFVNKLQRLLADAEEIDKGYLINVLFCASLSYVHQCTAEAQIELLGGFLCLFKGHRINPIRPSAATEETTEVNG